MNLSADIEVYQASDITIDATVIDVSEVEAEVDKAFLREKGSDILMIEAKADFAIKKIVATIQGRASLAKGKVIAEVQDRFHEQFFNGKGLARWYESVGLKQGAASSYAAAYRATAQFQDLFDGLVEPTKVLECSDLALAKIQHLPTDYKEDVLAEIAVGNIPTGKEVAELASQPEVKLSKAQELLAAAKARKKAAEARYEEVKNDPDIPATINGEYSPEYQSAKAAAHSANTSVKRFEEQIATLQKQVEEEKLKTAQAAEREAKAKKELQQLKFDDAKTREERVKRLTSSLTIGVPQALADLQKFFAEKDHYPEDVRKHVLEQATHLANYIGDQL